MFETRQPATRRKHTDSLPVALFHKIMGKDRSLCWFSLAGQKNSVGVALIADFDEQDGACTGDDDGDDDDGDDDDDDHALNLPQHSWKNLGSDEINTDPSAVNKKVPTDG